MEKLETVVNNENSVEKIAEMETFEGKWPYSQLGSGGNTI